MFTIKKLNNKTKYVLTSTGLWVRDFTTKNPGVDINEMISTQDYRLFVENEIAIKTLDINDIDSEIAYRPKFLIVSDGYDFNVIKKIIPNIPKDVTIIGTNRTLAKWKNEDNTLLKRKMDYFLVNNPYKECVSLLPKHRYFPKCIMSSKTNPDFAKRYEGTLYKYNPMFGLKFRGDYRYSSYIIDDYRNPICAAISLAFHNKASKIALLCCDDSFSDERPGAVQLPNKLWTYPQHQISHGLIEGNLYWLTHQEDKPVLAVNCSHGPEYKEVPYIKTEKLIEFFQGAVNEG